MKKHRNISGESGIITRRSGIKAGVALAWRKISALGAPHKRRGIGKHHRGSSAAYRRMAARRGGVPAAARKTAKAYLGGIGIVAAAGVEARERVGGVKKKCKMVTKQRQIISRDI